MEIPFVKYHGTGNDFVMIDNRDGAYHHLSVLQIQHICSRRFGVGADGLIMIEWREGMDFYMNYFNSDGSQSFCGNGSRCAVAFARTLGIQKPILSFSAIDGPHQAIVENDLIKVKMKDVSGVEYLGNDLFIDTGSPHYIRFVQDLFEMDVVKAAHEIRYNDRFKEAGTNVNFLEMEGGQLAVRTYERGVEAETYSCGTGVTAAALALSLAEQAESPVAIGTLGGGLSVSFDRRADSFTNIWLMGPAVPVYKGSIQL